MQISYHTYYTNCKNIEQIRLEMVKYSIKYGKKAAAIAFDTTVKTVRKWANRYEEGKSREALSDKSRARKTQSNTITQYWIQQILDYAEKTISNNKRFKIKYCKTAINCPYSIKTMSKVLHRFGILKKKKHKKHERKKDLRNIKKNLNAFEKLQIDIKYLDDIPEFFRDYMQYGFPRYQITARDVKSGGLFIGFAREKSRANVVAFLHYIIEHLSKHGVDLSKTIIQTDNGTEFITGFNSKKDSLFTKYANIACKKHMLIPPGACTYNSDVEASHRLIEEEFYSQKYFNSQNDILKQSFDYINYFNFERYNNYKGGTPLYIMKNDFIGKHLPPNVLSLKPIIVDFEFDRLTSVHNCVNNI